MFIASERIYPSEATVRMLSKVQIVVADADMRMGNVLKSSLIKLGFGNVHVVQSADRAMALLSRQNIDFLITEWELQDATGVTLVERIRRSTGAVSPLLPVLMLTGRAEQRDVETARDAGVHEYVVKPFTVRTVFNRVQQLVENPRNFVLSSHYVGPERRRRGNVPEGMTDRRIIVAEPMPLSDKTARGHVMSGKPKVLMPDWRLKQKIGGNVSLNTLITPALLDQAQQAIDAIADESLGWIREDIGALEQAFTWLVSGVDGEHVVDTIRDRALSVKSRAGTFGYGRASEIAYMLYLFCRNVCKPEDMHHHIVVLKHIEVLKIMFGTNAKGDGGPAGAQIVEQLKQLAVKWST